MSRHDVTGSLGKTNKYNNDNSLTELNVLIEVSHDVALWLIYKCSYPPSDDGFMLI